MNRDQSAILEEEEEGIGDVYPNTIFMLEGFKLRHLGGSSTSMLQATNLRMKQRKGKTTKPTRLNKEAVSYHHVWAL
jgi:hypothetical protein